jgi:hypothetical protein
MKRDHNGETGPTRARRRIWRKLLAMRAAGQRVDIIRDGSQTLILADFGGGDGRQVWWQA